MTANFANAYSFKCSFLETVMSFDNTYVSAYLGQEDVNIFNHRFLLLPFHKGSHYSLFVVVGAHSIQSYHKPSFKGDRPCILHFDPSGLRSKHDSRYISHKIRSWLNCMMRMKNNRGDILDNPYNKRSMPDIIPEGSFEC